jgi:transcription termination factor Rho
MREELESMKVPDLKAKAKELGIEGADAMKKADLIDAILEAGSQDDDDAGGDNASADRENFGGHHSKSEMRRMEAQQQEPAAEASGEEGSETYQDTKNKAYEEHPKFHKFKKGNEK